MQLLRLSVLGVGRKFRYLASLLFLWTLMATALLTARWWRLAEAPVGVAWRGDVDDASNCRLPVLPLDTPQLRALFHRVERPQCDSEPGWVVVNGSRLTVREAARSAHGNFTCQFTDLMLEDDERVIRGSTTSSSTGYTLVASDFVLVDCVSSDDTKWHNVMAGARAGAARHAVTLHQLPPNHLPLNVLILGIDSLSRNTFERKLPKTTALLRDILGAVVLRGYNIVGDGTPQALIPILTGRTEPELPEVRKRKWGAHRVNIYPLIWDDFERDGYVTTFAEDQPNINTFNYRLTGFDPQPTHHYMRTFWLAVDDQIRTHPKFCLRDKPRHQVQMEYVESLWAKYPDKAKFVFTFTSELSHDDINLVGVSDDDVAGFLWRMWSSGRLNNTALLVMADHGHRFTAIRNTQQGKLEERLPFFSWALPTWFRHQYPQAMEALRQHAGQLTTPFDQYQTLQHLRHWPDGPPADPTGRGRTLLRPAPARGCSAAGVAPHWCACLRWRAVSPDAPDVRAAAAAFQQYVNELQRREAADLCASLHVQQILAADVFEPQANLLRFVRTDDGDGFHPDLSGQPDAAEQLFQLRMRASPGRRMFEATITRRRADGRFVVRHEDVSRTDRYGSQARCVLHKMDHMRKLCFCR